MSVKLSGKVSLEFLVNSLNNHILAQTLVAVVFSVNCELCTEQIDQL